MCAAGASDWTEQSVPRTIGATQGPATCVAPV